MLSLIGINLIIHTEEGGCDSILHHYGGRIYVIQDEHY